MSRGELPSWRETRAKQSIMESVAAVTNADSTDFVPARASARMSSKPCADAGLRRRGIRGSAAPTRR